ncbi:YwmB family TATA-box binding protein [Bacillus sp. WMMC1349]|uniref:YwmB family TATA-box binding protein n=1 Tax=Bacillus sp. WMMC1349 TaxID=2736254 RepID=UPI0015571836|nr:YwmB family TATA-box binding protein [Bacillus sp. WMMC1349]NPC94440.1 YwmB family TATA-box binding protein [Bacillus sp. WMMC1349]
MKKKQLVNAIILFGILMIGVYSFKSLEAAENTPLLQLVTGLTEHHVELDEWTLHTKKQFISSKQELIEKVKHFKKQYRQYQWTFTQTNQSVKATGIHTDQKNNIKSTIRLESTLKKQGFVSYLLYEQKGAGQRENWNHTYKQFERKAFDILRENTIIFTCLKGHLSGMMNVVLQKKANDLINEFKGKLVEKLIEPNFVSISAYTNEWRSIKTENQQMNLQISLRNAGMGEKLTVTVGTPIITTEY